MNVEIIEKPSSFGEPPPVLANDPAVWADFRWDDARAAIDGLSDGELNMARQCVDRHVAEGRGEQVALRWIGRGGECVDITYESLAESTSRFANVLVGLGVEPGDLVVAVTGRIPMLYSAVLGTLKHRAVACTLFSAFGPEPIRQRLEIGRAQVLVTTDRLYRRKIAPIRESLPELRHVLIVDAPDDLPEGTEDLDELMRSASGEYEIGPTPPDTQALIHFTSGTTGAPKGAMHCHEAIVAHHTTASFALDLRPGDTYWCTADPGWVTGTSYGILAPLSVGVTSIVDEGDFDAERWYSVLTDHGVNVWYTAPTAVRMMMRGGARPAAGSLDNLRFIASVGEPLNPEAVRWGVEAFGLPIHDNWWQTETGGIMIANCRSTDIRVGSMGRPLPGIEAGILRRDEHGNVVMSDGEPEEITEPLVEGELALRPGWPSMFRGYLDAPERYAKCFAGGWYLSGDLAMADADGFFWFVGRADDVIKSAGHLIGPFEVESALMEHEAVAEVGVIGIPDPIAGEVVKAFVALREGFTADDELKKELHGLARSRLGAAVAPREIEFRDHLPKTRSGKIMRRVLKARELGLPEGDLSALESS